MKTPGYDSDNFLIPDFKKIITKDMINKIKIIKNLALTQYSNLNIPDTFTFYTKRYVQQLYDFT